MRSVRAVLLLCAVAACAPASRPAAHAARVTITRDDWGIAHVKGHTDADAVFGMVYAQAEDDFDRVETNYLVALGRLAQAEGETAIWKDLRQRLFVSDDDLRKAYAASEPWLRRLMDAWAAGLNAYLAAHPEVKPRVLTHFEPWMALSFTEGSIGGDIERIPLADLAAFYGGAARAQSDVPLAETAGSNGIAIGPRNTVNGRALLLINPHTSFYFRSELQVTSDEGLDAYGAVTWGQFFIYQGFNARVGWMHTSSGVDAVDFFLETISERDGKRFYRYGDEQRPLVESTIAVPYRTASGELATRSFTVYRTHRGPIVRAVGDRWVSVALMNKPVAALSQSFLRTKARSFAEYQKVMELRANSSNNTVYADADGTIAYLHPQFVPRRDDRFDYRDPVPGDDPATDWRGEHALNELPQVVNPPNGWIQNTNDWPYSAAGPGNSPLRERYPRYFDVANENPRGLHAMALLEGRRDLSIERLRALAFDTHMPGLARMVPLLLAEYDRLPPAMPLKARLAGPIGALRGWDFRWSLESIPTTLAVPWGEELTRRLQDDPEHTPILERMVSPAARALYLEAFAATVARLEADFGTWQKPWGEINRFQRLTAAIAQSYDDAAPSVPVGFTPGGFGSLASFGVAPSSGTRRRYGAYGNSFVAIVELGPDGPHAIAVTAGGASGHPGSPHFRDQIERYSTGALRPVYFRPQELEGHVERRYEPR